MEATTVVFGTSLMALLSREGGGAVGVASSTNVVGEAMGPMEWPFFWLRHVIVFPITAVASLRPATSIASAGQVLGHRIHA